MNTKIYFNNKFIVFEGSETQSPTNQHLKTYKDDNNKDLKTLIFNFIETDEQENIKVIVDKNINVVEVLKKHFYYIEAAGGFIEKENKYLFIHRFGRWDLPKGKLEKKESIEAAAVRECEEECDVKDLSIIKQLSSTFHIYAYKDGYALKQTYWFKMHTDYSGKLNPQLEESIDEVKWFSSVEIKQTVMTDTYHTIVDVISEVLQF